MSTVVDISVLWVNTKMNVLHSLAMKIIVKISSLDYQWTGGGYNLLMAPNLHIL